MTVDIDPIEFGKLLQAVSNLTRKVDVLTDEVDSLKNTMSGGKGVMIGLMIAAGGLGAGVSHLMDRIFK